MESLDRKEYVRFGVDELLASVALVATVASCKLVKVVEDDVLVVGFVSGLISEISLGVSFGV